jgi:hypothetical protein
VSSCCDQTCCTSLVTATRSCWQSASTLPLPALLMPMICDNTWLHLSWACKVQLLLALGVRHMASKSLKKTSTCDTDAIPSTAKPKAKWYSQAQGQALQGQTYAISQAVPASGQGCNATYHRLTKAACLPSDW